MNDNELIKALKQHIECTEKIKYGVRKKVLVDAELLKDILDLINRRQLKIEFLQSSKNLHEAEFNSLKAELKLSKAIYKEKQAEFDLLNCKYNILINEMGCKSE